MPKKFALNRGFVAAEFLFILFTIYIARHSCVMVEIEEGQISGTTFSLANGKLVHSFLGVPYAVPPVGKYRFKVIKIPIFSICIIICYECTVA